MDPSKSPEYDLFNSLLAWVEAHLDEPLTLEQIAQHAGLSPFHFSRLFTARMGRSVMSHVRGRRLIRGARRLTEEPGLKLIDLSFDCRFESQEAFTRAFKRLFGVSPGRFRAGFAITPIEGQFPMSAPSTLSADVVKLPDLVSLAAFRVAGPTRRFDQSSKSDIPQLWTTLIGGLPFTGQSPDWSTYGVVDTLDKAEGSFQYMAAVGVQPGAMLPEGFEEKAMPAATYVVFRITLNGGPPHPQIKSAMATIWGELVPRSGLTVASGPDFERYDGHFAPDQPGAIIDFHVPVEV
ncbi:MAG TPA: AraC family transcriptional regulator [Candidatus Aquabacterium excrementipullorum]|nr:AraC family transcriptional regulator [Candidatus Aquabacterium excrementipullorum]